MINRMKNYPSFNNDDNDDDENLPDEVLQEIEELIIEVKELKKVAARTVLRATNILDANPNDADVAKLLLEEAVVMMQVVHRIESYIGDDFGK